MTAVLPGKATPVGKNLVHIDHVCGFYKPTKAVKFQIIFYSFCFSWPYCQNFNWHHSCFSQLAKRVAHDFTFFNRKILSEQSLIR